MKHTLAPAAACLVAACLLGQACDSVPIDDQRSDSRLFPARGVVRGTVLYQGPHPCSRDGHVVGNAVLLFFAADNPPPPAGLATTAVNFGTVTGDVLFANEPRNPNGDLYCPKDHGITDGVSVSAPYAVSPFDPGTYIVAAFFDYQGDFLPTFKFRNLPEMGDVAGGYVDTTDAAKHAGDPNYHPIFFPITVGVPQPGYVPMTIDAGDGGSIVSPAPLVMPASGFVADNVPVTIGSVEPLTRPYFYPQGSDQPAQNPMATTFNPSADPNYVPVATMAEDIQIDAPPAFPSPQTVMTFQSKFPTVKLLAGLPANEAPAAVDPAEPFHFQLAPTGIFVWSSGQIIPEGNGVPSLYPLVVFNKLVDDPNHTGDPQSLAAQGPPHGPVVVILGITLGPTDSILDMVLNPPDKQPDAKTAGDHVSALVRPSAICIDPTNLAGGATLVAPFLTGPSADPNEMVPPGGKPLFDPVMVSAALSAQFGRVTVKQGCLPPGRYGINAVYPTSQAWTVPNETGSCAPAEGVMNPGASPLPQCTSKVRSVLYSQGTRAVLEVTQSAGSATCAQFPVPPECLPK